MRIFCTIDTSDTSIVKKKSEGTQMYLTFAQDIRTSGWMIERGTVTSLSSVMAVQFRQVQDYRILTYILTMVIQHQREGNHCDD